MNAAFLLITTAWLAGAEAPPPAKPAPVPAPAASGCCDDCGHHGWGERFRGMFHKCGCESSCDSCKTGLLDKFKSHCGHECGGCDTGCKHHEHHAHHCQQECHNACDSCGHRGWGERFKGMFHRGCGCDDGCNGCGSAAPGKVEPIPAPRGGEAPKKMPEAPSKSVQILTPQSVAPASTVVIE